MMHEEFEFNTGRLRLCGQFSGAQMAGEHYTSQAGCAGRLRLCGQFSGAQTAMAGEHYTSRAGCGCTASPAAGHS